MGAGRVSVRLSAILHDQTIRVLSRVYLFLRMRACVLACLVKVGVLGHGALILGHARLLFFRRTCIFVKPRV